MLYALAVFYVYFGILMFPKLQARSAPHCNQESQESPFIMSLVIIGWLPLGALDTIETLCCDDEPLEQLQQLHP